MNTISRALVLSAGLVSSTAMAASIYDYADVVSVQEAFESVRRPVERCQVEPPPRQQAAPSPLGAVIGAGVGGVIGHQFGNGRGKDWATAGGAIAGAIIGNGAAEEQARGANEGRRRCWTEDSWTRVSVGYDVTYRYGDREFTTRMGRDPGRQLEVEVSVRPTGR